MKKEKRQKKIQRKCFIYKNNNGDDELKIEHGEKECIMLCLLVLSLLH